MDNHHVYINESSASCGILELSRISEDCNKVLFAMASYLYHPSRGKPAAYYLWSTLNKELCKLIVRIFGPIQGGPYQHGPIENPRTGNGIYVFLWPIPHKEFKEWYQQERINRIKAQQ